MTDAIEQAQEGIEHAHHASDNSDHSDNKGPRRVAILIAALAAALALAEMGEKAAQNSYLTHHITVSDTYAFLQAKNIRRATYLSAADVIDSLPSTDDAARKRSAALRAEADRMASDPKTNEGSKELGLRAKAETHARDEAFEEYHHFERSTGALQIAIVLASVSVVTKVRALTYTAALIGIVAAIYAAAVHFGLA